MLPSWCDDTIVISRPKKVNSRGSLIDDWSNPTQTTVNGCSVQPSSTSLSMDGRVLGITDSWTAYLPSGTDVKEGDRVTFNGQTFVINGAPEPRHSPMGRISGIQLNLKRWSG